MSGSSRYRELMNWGARHRRGVEIHGASFSTPKFNFTNAKDWRAGLILSHSDLDNMLFRQMQRESRESNADH